MDKTDKLLDKYITKTNSSSSTCIPFQCRSLIEELPGIKVESKYLILCGNIGRFADPKFPKYLKILCDNGWEKVFYVIGPMEYKQFSYQDIEESCSTLKKKLGSRLEILNNSSFDLKGQGEENWRIIGTTLWTNLPKGKEYKKDLFDHYISALEIYDRDKMNSKLGSKIKKNRINSEQTVLACRVNKKWWNEKHEESKKFLREQILLAEKDDKKLIVITHHLPTQLLLPERVLQNDLCDVKACDDFKIPTAKKGKKSGPIRYWFCACPIPSYCFKTKIHSCGNILFYSNYKEVDQVILIKE